MKKGNLKRGTSQLKRGTSKLSQKPFTAKSSPLKKSGRIKIKPTSAEARMAKEEQRIQDQVFYEELWITRRPYSEISKVYLGIDVNKACIHHIIPKSVWKEGRYIAENCILLTIDEHAIVEGDMYRYEEINRRRDKLKAKYDL